MWRRDKQLDLASAHPLQFGDDLENIEVEGMDDYRQLALVWVDGLAAKLGADQGRAGGFQIAKAIGLVGLKVCAFCPFVPGIDKDEALLGILDALCRLKSRIEQPFLIETR